MSDSRPVCPMAPAPSSRAGASRQPDERDRGRSVGILGRTGKVLLTGRGRFPWVARFLLILICAIGGAADARLHDRFEAAAAPRPAPAVPIDDAAGRVVSLADFAGRFLVVNLWATWCAPCVVELPSLGRLHAEAEALDFAVLAVSVDRAAAETVRAFLERQGLSDLPWYHDRSGRLSRAFRVRGALPVTFLVDSAGRILGRLHGPADWAAEATKAFLAEAGGPARLAR